MYYFFLFDSHFKFKKSDVYNFLGYNFNFFINNNQFLKNRICNILKYFIQDFIIFSMISKCTVIICKYLDILPYNQNYMN